MMSYRIAIGLLILSASFAIATPPYPPEPISGALVIVGGGKLPDAARDEFFKLAGGTEKAKIVVIPTASADADKPDQAESFTKQWANLKPVSVTLLHTRDRKTTDNPEFIKPLTEATAVWFSGGDQTRIIAAYRGTAVERELHALLKRGGVIGGTSAGAAIMSDLMIEGGATEAKTGPGLGFLPGFVVDQHFIARKRGPRLQGVLEKHPEYTGLGIDENTAVVVKGRTLKVLGDTTVTVAWAKSSTKPVREDVLKTGTVLDLYQLRRTAHFRALSEPFPTKVASEPTVKNGSLVIVGGGGLPLEITDKFFELACGKDALIVVIPTAQDDPDADNHPEEKLFKRLGGTNVKTLHTRDRKQADDPEFSKMLLDAKGVWFGGGRQWRFVDSYEDTLVEKRFREVLERGGVIGGTSAGASIQSEYMPRGHPLGNTVVSTEGYERGFGFLPGCAVDQHFFARKRTQDMTGIMKLYPQILGIGIDEATAIVVTGSIAEVIGKTKVGFYDYSNGPPQGETDYVEVPTGEKYDLKARKLVK